MSVTLVAKLNADLHERSEDSMDELVALARMIAYARHVAQDAKVQLAAQCLDLALEAVKQEVGEGLIKELAELRSSVPQLSVKTH